MKKQILLSAVLACISVFSAAAQKEPVDYVNPFVGTTNYGTTNPGALTPHGMMSVTPFNVMGVPEGDKDKDKQWWSTPYEFNNKYLTGFAHVNLSGVGCPELGSLLLMPTTGKLDVDYHNYGSFYQGETANPGYYTNILDKYNVKCELTATPRTSMARFTFPAGQSNILLNLGDSALVDGVIGGWTYGDKRWQGFIDKKRMDVTIDMEKETEIHSVGADFMQVCGPEVFMPSEVIISVSNDGKEFTELKRMEHKVVKDDKVTFINFGWEGNAKARYIRYQASSGEFGGFLFTDEIVVK